jgi:hypothetical protein
MSPAIDIHIFSFSTLPDQRLLVFLGKTEILTVIVNKKDLRQIKVPESCRWVAHHNFPRVADLLEDEGWVEFCWLLSTFEMKERTTLQDIMETLVALEKARDATIH